MSMKQVRELACPLCNHKQQLTVWSVVNSKDDEATALVHSLQLNLLCCEACGRETTIEWSVIYLDVEQEFVVHYVCLRDYCSKAFHKRLTKQGMVLLGPAHSALDVNLDGRVCITPHYVFSLRELEAYVTFREHCVRWGVE